ncbi:ThiF family adenylyltransferase [Bacillus carboniphilus]|uniref:ThiF family adenylyltransferase n=1 Tax=Bacillus carboniphilus TaxID=86663 RepID=A0ABN0VX13_9BACI
MNPEFKKTFRPVIQKPGAIEVANGKNTIELDDEDGKLYALLNLLDGSRSVTEIARTLDIPLSDMMEALEALNELGFLEYNSAPSTYSPTELERYQANLNYFSGFASLQKSKFSYQDALRDAKVAVLGLGGGCLTATYLAGLGVGEIVGVDFDTISRTNLNRQFLYCEDDVGRLKSEVAEEKIRRVNPEVKVTMVNREIRGFEDLLDILEGCDVAVSMMDQPALISHRWVNAACVKLGIPYYRGGFSNHSMIWERFTPGGDEPCYDCKLIDLLQKGQEDAVYRLKTNYGRIFSGVNTGFAPNVSILTGLYIADVVKYITGHAQLSKPFIEMDTATMEMVLSDHDCEKKACCPTCGAGAGAELDRMVGLDELIEIGLSAEVLVDEL